MLKVVVVNPPTEEQKEQMYRALEPLYEEGEDEDAKDEVQYGYDYYTDCMLTGFTCFIYL